MDGMNALLTQVISGINPAGNPYPGMVSTNLAPFRDHMDLLGPPMLEMQVNTENGKYGSSYDLLVSNVIFSPMLDSYWFVYGVVVETLTTGYPEDIQVLAFRWFQSRGYVAPLHLWSCQYLEGRRLSAEEVKGIIKNIPAITRYKFIN